MENYVLLTPVAGLAFCSLQEIRNLAEPLDLLRGVSLTPWPADVQLLMDPNFPKSVQLPDCVMNLTGAIVVSPRLKDVIAASGTAPVEYLPVSIINHKGRPAGPDYFIVNPYPLQDCIDQAASVIEWNAIDPSLISACTHLVIDEERIAPGMQVFRLAHYPTKVLFARDLATAITRAGFTGIEFIALADMEY